MIAVDTNILVYAHRRDSEWHEKAYRVIQSLAEGSAPWAIPWPCLHEFLAVVTHPRIYRPPTPLSKALDQAEIWLGAPSLRTISELKGHWKELRGLAGPDAFRAVPFTTRVWPPFAWNTGCGSCGRRIATSAACRELPCAIRWWRGSAHFLGE